MKNRQLDMSSPIADSHLKEELVSSEELLKGNFLQVKRETIRLPDGASAPRANTYCTPARWW
jgi:ADP-ribose pyrophosphatase